LEEEYSVKKVAVTEFLDANEVLASLISCKKGDFSVRLPVNQVGLAGKIADTLNDIFELNENMATELARISTAVGKEGKIGQRAFFAAGVLLIVEDEALPIIAAKAMKSDREKCLQAGASNYVTKPVDLDHLFSVMRVWLARLLERAEASTSAGGD